MLWLSLFIIITVSLILYGYMFYIVLVMDDNFIYIIFSRKQLLGYWLYVIGILLVAYYIFFIRLERVGRVINIYEVWAHGLETIKELSWLNIIGLLIIILLMLIVGFLGIRIIYVNLYRRLLALYVYYYQYEFFSERIVGGQLTLVSSFVGYLVDRVLIFTERQSIVTVASIIWPRSFYMLEPKICKILLPYLVVFDIITQDGHLSKIFVVMPGYFVYMLIRGSWGLLRGFFKEPNTRFSRAVYKQIMLNGKLYRWISIPNPEELLKNTNGNRV